MSAVASYSLNWSRRLLLCGVAFSGSAVYAWSFAGVPQREQWLPVASAIGIAAGVSWVLLGIVLLTVTRCRPSVMAWADVCLVTMAVGIAMKMTAVFANFVSTPSASFHLAVLMAANLVMACVFICRARRLGLRPLLATGLWFGVLNGLFAVVMLGLRAMGWYR